MHPVDPTLLAAALVAGLLGSGHCLGMCGGIVGAFAMGVPAEQRQRAGRLVPYLVAYQIGRIATYATLGAAAGLAGATFAGLFPPTVARLVGRGLGAAFMLGLGLYLVGMPQLLTPFERLGARLWRRIEPLGRRLLRPRSPFHALALGAVWGMLPCGLVYSLLAIAITAGGALPGALTMLAFGLGTIPSLMAAGLASSFLARLARATPLRRLAAAAYLAAAVWLVVGLLRGGPHRHGQPEPPPAEPAATVPQPSGDHCAS